MLRKLLTITFILVFIISNNINAQTETLKDKIKKLKGKVEKILIVTDEGELEFTGEEAKSLLKKIKSEKHKLKKVWKNKDGQLIHLDEDSDHHMVFESKDDKVFSVLVSDDDFDIDMDVEIEEKDGEKKIIIKKNGEEYKVIEWHEDEHQLHDKDGNVKIMKLGDNDCKDVEVIIEKLGEGEHKNIIKKIEVENKGDNLKVIETIEEDGKERVKVYEGKDAEKFISEQEHIDVEIFDDKDKKMSKVIIKSGDASKNKCKLSKKVKIKKKQKIKKIEDKEEESDKD